MKKQLIFVFLIMLISASQAFAHEEDCQVYNVTISGYSDVFLLGDEVSGFAQTEIDFTVSNPPFYCFDYEFYADIESELQGPNVDSPQTQSGNPDSTLVQIEYDGVEAEPGTYCVTSNHQYGGSYIWEDHEGKEILTIITGDGFNHQTDECLTIEDPTSTPTPTPPCLGCQEPTPTPTVKITEVGFTGDRPIRQFEVENQPYIEEPDADGTVSTWKSNDNPKFPVAYKKGTSPTLFAKFTITPTLSTPVSAQIRIKKGNTVITSTPKDVTLTSNQIRVDGFSIPFSNLESGEFVKRSKYTFTWEISFDGGTKWESLDKKSEHKIHWLFDNPPNESDFAPFKDADGTPYPGLFDFALEWSTGKNTKDLQDIEKVIRKINSAMANRLIYQPRNRTLQDNPLKLLNGTNNREAVCWDNALILFGLLKSIGIPGIEEEYHWGGESGLDGQSNSGKRNYYCPPGGCGTISTDHPLGSRNTLQTKRDRVGCDTQGGFPNPECVERNPTFTYHATVKFCPTGTCPTQEDCPNGNCPPETPPETLPIRFDPSYGKREKQVELLTAVKVVAGQPPQCVRGKAATKQRVSRNTFGNDSLALNNDTTKVCSPRFSSIHSDPRHFRFDTFGGADMALVRGSTDEWIVMDEFGETTNLLSLEYDPTQDALVPADYDGDGITDPAVWYSNGDFFYRMSSNYYAVSPSIWRPKTLDEKAVPGDYDGDSISDIAAWRASDGKWFIRQSSNNTTIEIQWGIGSQGDIPVPGDYDNDGKTDIAIWRATTGEWWILRSSDWGYHSFPYGMDGDIPVQGDYDGDGATDYAVVRPSTGVWYFLESEEGYQFRSYPGPILSNNDIPVPTDYDSDSKTDVAVWFNSSGTWHIVESQTGELRQDHFGNTNDIPVVSAFVYK